MMVLSNNTNLEHILNRLLLLLKDMDEEDRGLVLMQLAQAHQLLSINYLSRKSFARRKKQQPNLHNTALTERKLSKEELKQLVQSAYEKKVAELTALAAKIAKLNEELERQHQILHDCEHHIHAYSQIPDYVGLHDELNREFAKRQLNTQACFACEYVISIKDEKWRDALETFFR